MTRFNISLLLLLIFNCTGRHSDQSQEVIDTTPSESQTTSVIKEKQDKLISVPVATLPYHYAYPQWMDTVYDQEKFLKYEKGYLKRQSLDTLFSPGTYLNFRNMALGHPYNGKAKFFKRLPDINNKKIILFSYWDMQTDYKLPTLELQIFDEQLSVVDQMIVVDGTNYECSWSRNFKCSIDYELEIVDKYVCWDLPSERPVFDTLQISRFRINDEGRIVPVSDSARTSLQKWMGAYSMTVNKYDDHWGDGLDVELTISRDAVIYMESGRQVYHMYLLSASEINGALKLNYEQTIDGGRNTVVERDFGFLRKVDDSYFYECPYIEVTRHSNKNVKRAIMKLNK